MLTTGPPSTPVGAQAQETGGDPRVSWNHQADGYRLPTEAEHELAAREGGTGDYAGSDDFFEVAPPDNKTAPMAGFAVDAAA